MKSLKEDVAEIATAARRQGERAFADAATDLDVAQRPHVCAHVAFAYLHMALVIMTSELLKAGLPAACSTLASEIHVCVPPRQVACRFYLHDTAIEVWFVNEVGRAWWRRWQPPATVDAAMLYDATRALARESAEFLTGLVSQPRT